MFLATAPIDLLRFAPTREPPPRSARMSPAADNSGATDAAREQSDLMLAMARRDKAALGRLYDALSRPLYSLAVQVTNDAADAQDIVQDVFLQLWLKAADYTPARGSVFSWAATLTRNRAIDRIRMRRRRAEIVHESAADLPGADTGAGESTAADALGLREQSTAIRSALTALPHEQRSAIELAFFTGLTQQEIAARLHEPLGTVKARIRRGLLKLREILATRP
jgi:RNA polymerase sigma-70 factor (ECF subfamily)